MSPSARACPGRRAARAHTIEHRTATARQSTPQPNHRSPRHAGPSAPKRTLGGCCCAVCAPNGCENCGSRKYESPDEGSGRKCPGSHGILAFSTSWGARPKRTTERAGYLLHDCVVQRLRRLLYTQKIAGSIPAAVIIFSLQGWGGVGWGGFPATPALPIAPAQRPHACTTWRGAARLPSDESAAVAWHWNRQRRRQRQWGQRHRQRQPRGRRRWGWRRRW
jgi:hypothetical protein